MTKDFTIAEALDAFDTFAASVGAKAACNATLGAHRRAGLLVHAFFQPQGSGISAPGFLIYGTSWRDLLANCEAKWAEFADTHSANLIREMALRIIALTADQGECTDAALRAEFDAADIARYGESACAQATEMASNGPFSIVTLSGANDAEAA
ncbi:hypothetical protein [Phenylobacterium sp.]|uniref:hypothetical protein n=1 Tax=Phenylobacterium sp. TaxID=1871053 RepID=UPI002FC88142